MTGCVSTLSERTGGLKQRKRFVLPYGVSFLIILLSKSFLAFFASSGDSVTSAELGMVGNTSNGPEQSIPVQPLSQKHWFKFEQICGQRYTENRHYFYAVVILVRMLRLRAALFISDRNARARAYPVRRAF